MSATDDQPLARHAVAGWVRAQRLTPAAKLVLLLVFDHAGPQEDGRWVAWVGNVKLAYEAGFAEGANGARTVRRHLSDMEALGIITREDRTRANGSQTTSRVVLLVRGDSTVPGGGLSDPGGRAGQSSPEAPSKPKGSPTAKRNAQASASAKAQKLPDDFPEELKPHARRVFAILRDIAEQHNAKEVTPRGVGLAIQGNPSRLFVAVAYELASWAQSGRDIKDAVGTYRTFLKRADRHAGIERFGDVVVAGGENVHPIRGGKAERVDWGQVARDLEAKGL